MESLVHPVHQSVLVHQSSLYTLPVRILFTRFPLESAYGGAEIQTMSLMKGLMERDHAVAFAGSCPVLLEMCKKERIPSAEIDIGIPPVTKWGVLSFAWRKKRMHKVLKTVLDNFSGFVETSDSDVSRKTNIDVICMLSLSEKLLLTADAANQGMRVLWIEHDRIGRWLTHNPWLPLLLEQSNHAITVPVSHLSAGLYKDLGWDPATIRPIANGIDQMRFPVRASRRDAPANKSHLICIARLSPEKGVDVLIEAMAGVPDLFTLEIVGTGPEERALKALAKSLHLQERITFSGYMKDLSDVYARADALILPSRDNDPFGLVAAEAMMQSIPVVITDECGIAGYLEDGTDAIIAKADSASALTKAIKRLSAEARKIADNGKKTAHEQFSVERMVLDYEQLMQA